MTEGTRDSQLALGCHLSVAQGFASMGQTALSIGATTFAFFTRNPRGGNAKPADEKDMAALRSLMQENGFGKLVAHAPYTMNLCSAKPDVVDFGRRAMAEDLRRLELLPNNYYNFHPGSHVGQGAQAGVALICQALDEVLAPGFATTVLLETMAGKGSEVGRTFEELQQILEGCACGDQLGVCLDTCHVWDGGYDVRDDLDGVLAEFDRVIGLDRLKALHLNDSKNPLGAHKDRHEKIGEGHIGLEAFGRIVRDPRLASLPMILETPNELDGYRQEIALLREAARTKEA
ncbi:MAG: deoxyribonuclease IV [Coriobacteriales bacterium]|nr:deoxyribonuclease IV [Coriobacteriales bacterium]